MRQIGGESTGSANEAPIAAGIPEPGPRRESPEPRRDGIECRSVVAQSVSREA